ncbi:MAG TPA: N-succinylarginine dihydrolase [Polyangiaceae bacterium]|jgi:succinylarginine dihydrolase|nr:N-succinylarginine dihydrolase [Polyangiaceae bacterium]
MATELGRNAGEAPHHEYNFDGIVGPTHNYGGLSHGNVASMTHEGKVANPRMAALEGLQKMRFVHSLGVGQGVLPPHDRPSLGTLRKLGFTGRDEEIVAAAGEHSEHLVRLVSSASPMWCANAATIAPSCDTSDGRLHVTPANLHELFHRAIEAQVTGRVLGRLFADERRFVVHEPLPGAGHFGDEGAANHMRFSAPEGEAVHLFAWGRSSFGEAAAVRRFPARQTREASEALARRHLLSPSRVVFAQQHPRGIDAGAFHTDVLGVSCGAFLMMHEIAFLDGPAITQRLRALLGSALSVEVATEDEFPLADAVTSYAFNSALVTLDNGAIMILAPEESRENPRARAFLERVLESNNPVKRVEYFNLRQSMHNGGGPACLRLRVQLSEAEVSALGARMIFSAVLDDELVGWVKRHYRDRLLPGDLRDPKLARESFTALDELTGILQLGSVYDFQKT